MNCASVEQLIALYVEDDLQAADRGRVESHLRLCATCAALAADLRESQDAFKALRQEVPGPAAFTNLRQRVLANVEDVVPSSTIGLWLDRLVFGGLRRKAALAGIALFAVGFGALWFGGAEVDSIAPPPVVAESAPAVTLPADLPSAPAPARPKGIRRAAPPRPIVPAEPDKEVVRPQVAIKLLTDDPNVIIYWLVDEQGE